MCVSNQQVSNARRGLRTGEDFRTPGDRLAACFSHVACAVAPNPASPRQGPRPSIAAVVGCCFRVDPLVSAEAVPDAAEKIDYSTKAADLYTTKFSNAAEAVRAYEAILALDPDHAGAIDFLINNAGVNFTAAVEDLRLEDWRRQFETNFFALVGFTRKVFPLMLRNEGEGRIVNVRFS